VGLRYECHAPIEDVQAAIAEELAELRRSHTDLVLDDGQRVVRQDIERLGISAEPDGAGITEVGIELIVTFAPVVAAVARDVWKHFILPRLRARFGDDSINEIEDDDDE
jgi:hypothetical protein